MVKYLYLSPFENNVLMLIDDHLGVLVLEYIDLYSALTMRVTVYYRTVAPVVSPPTVPGNSPYAPGNMQVRNLPFFKFCVIFFGPLTVLFPGNAFVYGCKWKAGSFGRCLPKLNISGIDQIPRKINM